MKPVLSVTHAKFCAYPACKKILAVAGSLAGLSASVAHAQLCASPNADAALHSVHNLTPSWNSAVTSPEAPALDTPSHGPHSSADFLLTAPDTQGNQQVMERIYLASPSQMLAAPTSPKSSASRLPAAGSEMQQSQTAGADYIHFHNTDSAQSPDAPAVSAIPGTVQQSSTPARNPVQALALAGLAAMQREHVDPNNHPVDKLADERPASMPEVALREQHIHMEDAGRASNRG